MSSEMPKGWSVKPLGEVADLIMGQSPPSSAVAESGEGLPFIQGNAEFGARHPTPRFVASTTPKVVRSGDILISVRAPVGEVNIAEGLLCIGRGVGGIRAKECDPAFLYYAVGGLSQTFARLSQGSTFDAINSKELRSIEIRVPPLGEQQGIAEVLRSVDEAITANRRTLDQTAQMRAATLHAAFEESAWEPVRLADLGRWFSGGTPSKADSTLWDGDIPWICPRDMKTSVVVRANSSVSEKAVGKACKLVPKGTLLLVVRGMILANAIPSATTAMEATFNQDIKAFRPNGRAIPKFVQLCLQHQEHGLLRLVNTATHGTKKLDSETIAEVDVPLPDLPTQYELSDAIADMDTAMVRSGEEHIRLTLLKSALQSDLLTGRVRVPE